MEPLYYDESSRGRYYLEKERRVASRIRKGGEGKAWLMKKEYKKIMQKEN